jgi:hypothetical protein
MIRKVLNPILVVAVVMLAAACAQQQRTESAPPVQRPSRWRPEVASGGSACLGAHGQEPHMASESRSGMTQEQLQEAMTRGRGHHDERHVHAGKAAMARLLRSRP